MTAQTATHGVEVMHILSMFIPLVLFAANASSTRIAEEKKSRRVSGQRTHHPKKHSTVKVQGVNMKTAKKARRVKKQKKQPWYVAPPLTPDEHALNTKYRIGRDFIL